VYEHKSYNVKDVSVINWDLDLLKRKKATYVSLIFPLQPILTTLA
jgi:hypothetical protein